MKKFDALIIGSGQAGTPLSRKLAKLGWKVALIEKEAVGGTCVNVGCTPTKTMIASAKIAYDISKAAEFGIHVGTATVDIKKVLARKDKVVESARSGSQKGLETTDNLELIFGTATFTGAKEIKVAFNNGGEETFTADHIFINAGARPVIPAIEGLSEIEYLTSTTIMELQEVPEHLLVLGGSYVGLEFGQMYRRFGSKVTIVESNSRFLPKEDEDIADSIRNFLEEEKISIKAGGQIQLLKKDAHGIAATLKIGKGEEVVHCSHVLLAAGRESNADLLKVEVAGIAVDDRGFIKVDNDLQTNVKGIFALGDIKGGPAFTHISYNDYLLVYKFVVDHQKIDYHNRQVPYTMFTDPQLGRVGVTEKEAREKGLKVRVATLPMSHVARAIETGDTRGMMKAVVDAASGEILGVAVLGQQGGEVMTVLQMAMLGSIKWQQVRELPIAHPLYAESLNNLFMQLDKK
jgi:pyruvate/2-oxoglutarate dehydrogenase complex dihydrolipoamide dehydrogenase (E3) component